MRALLEFRHSPFEAKDQRVSEKGFSTASTPGVSGRRHAQRDGYPRATLLGAPLDTVVGQHGADLHARRWRVTLLRRVSARRAARLSVGVEEHSIFVWSDELYADYKIIGNRLAAMCTTKTLAHKVGHTFGTLTCGLNLHGLSYLWFKKQSHLHFFIHSIHLPRHVLAVVVVIAVLTLKGQSKMQSENDAQRPTSEERGWASSDQKVVLTRRSLPRLSVIWRYK